MTARARLAELSQSDVTVARATRLIRQVLEAEPRSGEYVYQALSGWCWRALVERRVDEELRLWFDLMEKTAALLELRRQRPAALKIAALSDLVYASVQFSERNAIDAMLRRPNVQAILELLVRRGSMSKRDLMERTGLKQANLSRITADMIAARLLEREASGREAWFLLTSAGRQAALGLLVRRRLRSGAQARTAVRQRKPEPKAPQLKVRVPADAVREPASGTDRPATGMFRGNEGFTGMAGGPGDGERPLLRPLPLGALYDGPAQHDFACAYRRKPAPGAPLGQPVVAPITSSGSPSSQTRLPPPRPNYIPVQSHELAVP